MPSVAAQSTRIPTYELKSKLLKGGHIEGYIGDDYMGFKGDPRSLDYGSYTARNLDLGL